MTYLEKLEAEIVRLDKQAQEYANAVTENPSLKENNLQMHDSYRNMAEGIRIAARIYTSDLQKEPKK